MKKFGLRQLMLILTVWCMVLGSTGCSATMQAIEQVRQQDASEASSQSTAPQKPSVTSGERDGLKGEQEPSVASGTKPKPGSKDSAPTKGKDMENPDYISFTKQMRENGMIGGIAYIGYIEGPMEGGYRDFFEEYGYLEEYSFLAQIPQDRWVKAGGGHLYCIVSADPNSSVAVNEWIMTANGTETGTVGEVLYRSDSGEPILLFCDNFGFAQLNAQVNIVDDNGNVVSLCPFISPLDGYLYLDEWGGDLIDFTLYDDQLMGNYYYEEATPETLLGAWMAPDAHNIDGEPQVCCLIFNRGADGAIQMEYWYGPPETEVSEQFQGICYTDQSTGFIAFDMMLEGGVAYDGGTGAYQYNGEFLILYYPELEVIEVMHMDGYPLLYGMEYATIRFERSLG